MKFSIAIPVYNASSTLRECLESVSAQTFVDWECVCVDDGSTDESGRILDYYAGLDNRFKVVHQGNGGASAARNRALGEVSGDWVIFVDADDLMANNYLQVAYEMIESEHPDIVRLNYTFAKEPPPDFLIRQNTADFSVYEGAAATKWAWETFFPWGFLWVTFVRRDIIAGHRFPRLKCKEDGIWLVGLVPRINKVVVSSYKGYLYRLSSNSLSRKKREWTQCATYLQALAGAWREQNALASQIGLQNILQEIIRTVAEGDVIEWIFMRPYSNRKETKVVHSVFLDLQSTGAMQCRSRSKFRYRGGMLLWREMGWTWPIEIVGWLVMMFRGLNRIIQRIRK